MGIQRILEPDWASVAEHWDAIHLSWAGFLTTEGTTIDLGPGEVAMLRGWGSERTIWLNPVLSDPQPINPSPDDRLGRSEPDERTDVEAGQPGDIDENGEVRLPCPSTALW